MHHQTRYETHKRQYFHPEINLFDKELMILDNLRQALKIAEQVECHVAAEQVKYKWYFAIIGISESSAENQI